MIQQYSKFIVMIAFAVIASLVAPLADGKLSLEEVLNVAMVFLGALVVYLVPNLPEGVGRYLKTIVAGLTAAIVLLISSLLGGVSIDEWLQVILAFGAAVGVYVVPNVQIPELAVVEYERDQ